jgi:pimeloyl-ACP methyl ester carboxylesterase
MKIFKWIKRVFLGILLLLSLLLITGFIFERYSRSKSEKITPDGQFADVGGHILHYLRMGKDSVTVVFETALDPTGHLQWYNLQKEISKFATTVTYDRAGILWSERGINSKTGEKISEELHSLLEKAQVTKPYILVGHSFGGMLLRFYITKYPQEVKGVVLIDSQIPNDEDYLSPELYSMVNQGLPGGFLKFANSVGVARLLFKNMFPNREEYKYQNSIMPALIHKSAYGVLEEQDQMLFIKREANQIKSFGSIPLYIISATDRNRFDNFIKDERLKNEMIDAWDKMQKDLLKLSTDNKQILVPNSSHYINQDQPEIIIEAVKNMISKTNLTKY